MKSGNQLTLTLLAGLLCMVIASYAQDLTTDAATATATTDSSQGNGTDASDYEIDYESLEDELSELAEEHQDVREDCEMMKSLIDQANEQKTPVDPMLQSDYEECKQYLQDLEDDMEAVAAELQDDGSDGDGIAPEVESTFS